MAKPKSQTIQQRFGFMDKDLKSPKHDEIMLWLDDTVENHFNHLIAFSNEWQFNDFFVIEDEKELSDIQSEIIFNDTELPEKPKLTVVKKVWEYPISTKSGSNTYIVGFADMRVDFIEPSLSYYVKENKCQIYKERKSLFFEAKTEIPSLGELIRQIRMYQIYTNGKWFVVSPDVKFA